MALRDYDCLFKILLIGDCGVGKAEILSRFAGDVMSTSTIGVDFKIKTVELGGKKVKLQIWDTAGQDRLKTVTTSYYRGARGFMLVYDITNAETFHNLTAWMKNVDEHADKDGVKIIVGNSCDLEDKRQVDTTIAQAFAKEHDALFSEVSSTENINVEQAFIELAKELLSKTQDAAEQSGGLTICSTQTDSKKTSCF